HPVGCRRQEPSVAEVEETGEPTGSERHLGAAGAAGDLADQLNCPASLDDVDAGVAIRLFPGRAVAVRRHSRSSTNFDAASSTATGYSPSKQARQNASIGAPVELTTLGSDR